VAERMGFRVHGSIGILNRLFDGVR
jgi:hypothetical protein